VERDAETLIEPFPRKYLSIRDAAARAEGFYPRDKGEKESYLGRWNLIGVRGIRGDD